MGGQPPISAGFPTEPLASAGGHLWAIPSTGGYLADPQLHTLLEIDAHSGRILGSSRTRGRPPGSGGGRQQRLGGDHRAERAGPLLQLSHTLSRSPSTQGALWVTTVASGDLGAPGKDAVTRIDPVTGRTVATVTVPRAPLDLAATPRAVWVTNAGGGGDSVVRIDPETSRLLGRPVRTGASPQSLAVGGGSVWVANHDARTVTRIDQAS